VRTAAFAASFLLLLVSGAARAQDPRDQRATLPPPPPSAAPSPTPFYVEAPARPARPRLNAAVGAGFTWDGSGFPDGRIERVPAMFATGGFGDDWHVGGELSVFASTAVGRFRGASEAPVDRLAISVVGVLRPLSWKLAADDTRYAARLLRQIGVEAGPGVERDSTTQKAGSRWGLHTGLRLELPLGRPGPTELRIRLAARYMIGFYTPRVAMTDVGNSFESFAALVSSF
jgi:hypothetical protein